MARGLRTRLGIGLLSVAGTAAGHYLTYLVAAPHDHSRQELLQATGHTGESPFLILTAAALLAACVATLVGHRDRTAWGLPAATARLFALQLTAFVCLEVFERIAVSADLLDAATEPVIWLGVIAQFVVAIAGAFILKALRVAATTMTVRPPLPRFAELTFVALPVLVAPTAAPGRTWEARGPPRSS